LYERKLDYKYHKLQPEIVKGYVDAIDTMRGTESIEEIKRMKSLNCEDLVGNKTGIKSVRINISYRIEFIFVEETKTIYITSISKHYKEINIKYKKNENKE
jgi:proteic killer suppression protein